MVVYLCAFAVIGLRNVMRGTFLYQVAQRAAVMSALVMFSGCSDLALPREEMLAVDAAPPYGKLIGDYITTGFANSASYDAFEISGPRVVHSIKGLTWLVCVRFRVKGQRNTYAFFIKDKAIVDSRYAVQTDACDTQAYSPFDRATGSSRPGIVGGQGPIY